MLQMKKSPAASTPHPELTPLYDYECKPPDFERSPMLSYRDYSPEEIAQAKALGCLSADMREYCHNNGISWEARQCSRLKSII